MSVVVFGSINIDLVVQASRLPVAGETLTGSKFCINMGGKGANQAVAAANMGVRTKIVGRVGDDAFGKQLLEGLAFHHVDIQGIWVDKTSSSGTAMILLDYNKQNRIIVIPAANGNIGKEDLKRLEKAFADSDILLLQLEIPIDCVLLAAKKAKQYGVKVILDPAPAQRLPDTIYPLVDIITPNQNEAETLTGVVVQDENSAAQAASQLIERGIGQVIIKMGEMGAYWSDGARDLFIPAYKVEVVDTVAAGDTFNGCFAAALAEKRNTEDALLLGMAGGALSVSRQGAQQSIPQRQEVLQLFNMNKRELQTQLTGN